CGAQCASESDCWAWSYDDASSTCHVFPADAVADSTSGTSSSFRTYSASTLSRRGYFVPKERCRNWVEGHNLCNNAGAQIAYEADPDIMRDILNELSETTIVIGLRRTVPGASTWQDSYGNPVSFDSVNWQSDQPDNADGNEDKCISYLGEVADISQGSLLDPPVPVLCSL
ncbi:C-type lectin-like, partial [Trinorchestia longiramus]